MKVNLPANVIRYAAVIALIQYFVKALESPHYAAFLVRGRLELSYEQLGWFFSLSPLLGVILLVFGGILADKYGRRMTWAASLFLYGGGIVWIIISTSFEMALVAAAFIGISSAFSYSNRAWLYDSEGREGLRKAYGLSYMLSLPLSVVGIKTVFFLEDYLSDAVILLVAAALIMITGGIVITFPGSHRDRHHSCTDIVTSGVNQFVSSRVLQLIVLQSIFMGFRSAINIWWDTYFLEEVDTLLLDFSPTLQIISLAAACCAGFFLLLRKTNYRYFIIYPLIFTTVCFVLIPFIPTQWLALILILRAGISAGFIIETAGVFILINDVISSDRATALSFLGVFMGISRMVGFSLWGRFAEWEGKFFLAAALVVISLLILLWALKIHEKNTNVDSE